MQVTEELFTPYNGGQLEIQDPLKKRWLCGEIASITIRSGIMHVRFAWLAKGDAYPRVSRWESHPVLDYTIGLHLFTLQGADVENAETTPRLCLDSPVTKERMVFFRQDDVNKLPRGRVHGLVPAPLNSSLPPEPSAYHGVPSAEMSRTFLIAAIGHPSSWERMGRAKKLQTLLCADRRELEIGGIRGYGVTKGFIDYLEHSLHHPSGLGSPFITTEEELAIRTTVNAEVPPLLIHYRDLLIKLEGSREEVTAFIKRLVNYRDNTLSDINTFGPSEERRAHLAALEQDIVHYERLLANLSD